MTAFGIGPMADLNVTRDGELMVAHVEAETEEGYEFVDAYMPPGAEIVVVDSGRVILREADLADFLAAARTAGLTAEEAS